LIEEEKAIKILGYAVRPLRIKENNEKKQLLKKEIINK